MDSLKLKFRCRCHILELKFSGFVAKPMNGKWLKEKQHILQKSQTNNALELFLIFTEKNILPVIKIYY